MDISNASFVLLDSLYPCVAVEINGKPAKLIYPEHAELFYSGIVFLGSEFEGVVPNIHFRTSEGKNMVLWGFSRDRRLWKLVKMMVDDCQHGRTFKPGPVEIPNK